MNDERRKDYPNISEDIGYIKGTLDVFTKTFSTSMETVHRFNDKVTKSIDEHEKKDQDREKDAIKRDAEMSTRISDIEDIPKNLKIIGKWSFIAAVGLATLGTKTIESIWSLVQPRFSDIVANISNFISL